MNCYSKQTQTNPILPAYGGFTRHSVWRANPILSASGGLARLLPAYGGLLVGFLFEDFEPFADFQKRRGGFDITGGLVVEYSVELRRSVAYLKSKYGGEWLRPDSGQPGCMPRTPVGLDNHLATKPNWQLSVANGCLKKAARPARLCL